MFSEAKATQIAAYLIKKNGGKIQINKLMLLMVLAEMEAMSKWGETMTGDTFLIRDSSLMD